MTEKELKAVEIAVQQAVTAALVSIGIHEDEKHELRADFAHLRKWRKSVEQAQTYTFKAVFTVIATGLLGAVWAGFKVYLGK